LAARARRTQRIGMAAGALALVAALVVLIAWI
jgi:hypothetical protein